MVIGSSGYGDILNKSGMLRTPEQVFLDVIMEEPAFIRMVERRHAVELEVLQRTLEACKDSVDMMFIGEDLGTQTGPLISIDVFRKVLRPRLQKYVDLAKSFDLPVMIHPCGSSSWAFEDFLEMGIGQLPSDSF